jgi:two-component system, chemotaxis family, chemotaxis protein CheY
MSKVRKIALVVDDTEVHRTATRTFLVMLGFTVEVAEDGIAALRKMDEKTYDLIISDIEMPNMNGLEFLKRARKHNTGGAVPIIMLSTLDTEELKTKLLQLGANQYLVKPFSAASIKAAIQSVGLS